MKARGFAGRPINPPNTSTGIKRPRLTEPERSFLRDCIARGCTDIEATRLFFRTFRRDIHSGNVFRLRTHLT